MAFDWAFGIGSKNRTYADETDQTQEVKKLPPIQNAKNLYRQKNQAELSKEDCCKKSKLQPVTDYGVKFDVKRFIWASMNLSYSWHFIGSFNIDIYIPFLVKKYELM